jgi:K+-sensing histidine kinase KdpD
VVARLDSRWTRVLTVGTNPVRAAAGGLVLVVLLAVVLGPLQHQVTRATQGLTLVVPIIGAAVLGGRRAAFVVTAAATVAYSLVIPPVGSVRVRLTQDLVALVVFSIVAVVVGAVVARRIELLGEVERQRSALLRSVSHDLRTPLASIRAAASDLAEAEDEALPLAARHRFAALIVEEAERLDRLVANLLSLSRIEAGAYAPAPQSVDLPELIEAVTTRLSRPLAGVRLEVDAAPGLPSVHGDHTQLDQLLTNLLENAARHSPAGGTVRLTAASTGGVVTITVADEGPGLGGIDAARLFEPFRSGAVPGASGIGLAICRAVAEGHGGTIAAGDRPGGGAVFTVRLPVR